MVDGLKSHPFPVVAFFEKVVAVSFAFPGEVLEPLVEEGLALDTFEGLGFVTVALVWTRRLRPAGFPAFLGQDFLLAGYRIFTRLEDGRGRRLRGLKILRSETDRRRMVWSGNLLTRYQYRLIRQEVEEGPAQTRVRTWLPDGTPTLDIRFSPLPEGAPPPAGSPFADWRTARRFAGPMPFTFSGRGDGSFVVIEGSRQSWVPRPVAVESWKVGLFDEAPFCGVKPVLANAFTVRDVDYRWERGRIVRPGGAGR